MDIDIDTDIYIYINSMMYHFNMEKSREIATTKTPVSLPYYTDRMLRCMFDIFCGRICA